MGASVPRRDPSRTRSPEAASGQKPPFPGGGVQTQSRAPYFETAGGANGTLITTELGHASRGLITDTTTPSLRFSRDGVLEMSAFEGRPGWGLDPRRS